MGRVGRESDQKANHHTNSHSLNRHSSAMSIFLTLLGIFFACKLREHQRCEHMEGGLSEGRPCDPTLISWTGLQRGDRPYCLRAEGLFTYENLLKDASLVELLNSTGAALVSLTLRPQMWVHASALPSTVPLAGLRLPSLQRLVIEGFEYEVSYFALFLWPTRQHPLR